MRIQVYYVYILTNAHHTVLYTGVTNDLERRMSEQKQKKIEGFTKKYNVDKLIYFESFDSIDLAIVRENRLKGFPESKNLHLLIVLMSDGKNYLIQDYSEPNCKQIQYILEKNFDFILIPHLILDVFPTKR